LSRSRCHSMPPSGLPRFGVRMAPPRHAPGRPHGPAPARNCRNAATPMPAKESGVAAWRRCGRRGTRCEPSPPLPQRRIPCRAWAAAGALRRCGKSGGGRGRGRRRRGRRRGAVPGGAGGTPAHPTISPRYPRACDRGVKTGRGSQRRAIPQIGYAGSKLDSRPCRIRLTALKRDARCAGRILPSLVL
jgi:hypothetical protein